jgi:hypothetical protein
LILNIEGRRERTLYEEMSREKLAGLSLDDILANQKRAGSAPPSQPPPPKSRTLLDIIKEDETNKNDRR